MNTQLISETYPFVTQWDKTKPNPAVFAKELKKVFASSYAGKNISLYLHLPFCETLCNYCCFEPIITKSHTVEDTYIDYLLKEWKLYLSIFGEKPIIRQLHLGGGTPTFFSLQNLERVFQNIKDTAFIIPNAEISFEMQVNHTQESHLELFRKYGCNTIYIGLQDFDTKVQELIRRKQTYNRVESLVKAARFLGYETICVDLLYGLPSQTRASVIDTMYKIRLLKPERVNWTPYIHNPQVNEAQRSFQHLLPFQPEREILYEMGKKMLLDSGYTEIGNNHYVLKSSRLYNEYRAGNMHYNYIGFNYANTKMCIGLGARAATDIFTLFARNTMKLETYYQALDKNQLPLERIHRFSKDRVLLRRHFLNILCRGKTRIDKKADARVLNTSILEYLEQTENEKLFNKKGNQLIIRKKGIQNIPKLYATLLQHLTSEEKPGQTGITNIKLA